jgi:hypothetical protein
MPRNSYVFRRTTIARCRGRAHQLVSKFVWHIFSGELVHIRSIINQGNILWEDIIDGGATKEQTEYIEQTAWYKYKSLIYESDTKAVWNTINHMVKKMVVGPKLNVWPYMGLHGLPQYILLSNLMSRLCESLNLQVFWMIHQVQWGFLEVSFNPPLFCISFSRFPPFGDPVQ